MEAGGQELNLLLSPSPGTDLNRPHRSLALHGAASFDAARSRWLWDERMKYDTFETGQCMRGG